MLKIYRETVTEQLWAGLKILMNEPLFQQFRLVGGTSLSLQKGHRMSVDIDLFTGAPYGTIDFKELDVFLRDNFSYVSPGSLTEPVSLGASYIIGDNADNAFKLDVYYTDAFVWDAVETHEIRMASLKEITAMKMDIIQRRGRKKDFWDIHELLDHFSIDEMILFHEQRYPYSHDATLIRTKLTDFSAADEDFEPVCLKGKHWEIIKLDIIESIHE